MYYSSYFQYLRFLFAALPKSKQATHVFRGRLNTKFPIIQFKLQHFFCLFSFFNFFNFLIAAIRAILSPTEISNVLVGIHIKTSVSFFWVHKRHIMCLRLHTIWGKVRLSQAKWIYPRSLIICTFIAGLCFSLISDSWLDNIII